MYLLGCPAKTWQDGSTSTCKRKTLDEGKRFIVLHAGSRNGFVDGAEMVFASANKSGDYHGNMNGEMFGEWLQTKLLPALEAPSVVVLDNASYHSVQGSRNFFQIVRPILNYLQYISYIFNDIYCTYKCNT